MMCDERYRTILTGKSFIIVKGRQKEMDDVSNCFLAGVRGP